MAVSNVELRVDARNAISALQQVNRSSAQTDASFNKLKSATDGLSNAFAGLAAGAAAFNAQRIATSFIAAANAADGAQRRIRLVSQGFDDYRSVLQTAEAAATKFGLSQTQAASAIADIYTRLRPVGFQLNEINAIYEGFNTAVKLSGVSAEAASSAFLQLSQGLGSGTLQGDELRSVLEQMPAIAQAIANEMDINVGSIKEFGSQGKITSDIIVRALDRVRTDGAGKLAESLDTPQQRVIDLQNAFQDFQIEVGSAVAPAVIGSIKGITEAIREATTFIGDLKTGFDVLAAAAGGLGNIEAGLGGINSKLSQIGANKGLATLIDFLLLGGPSILGAIGTIGQRRRGRAGYAAPAGPEMPVRLSMQGRTFGRGGGAARGEGSKAAREAERAAEAATKEQERVAQLIRDRLAEGQILQIKSTLQDKISAAEMAGDQMLAARLQGQQKEIDLQYKYAQALAQEKDTRAQQAIIFEAQTALVANQREVQRELNELQNKSAKDQIAALEGILTLEVQLTEQQKQQKEVADGIANTIGQGMTAAFDAIIQGSEDFGASLRRIASGVLIDIAKQLLQVFVIQKAINAISGLFGGGGGGFSYAGVSVNPLTVGSLPSFGGPVGFSTAGLGFRANGGSVRAGQPYIVGERGPELFMPGRSGGIAPAGSFGGGANVVVNVDAKGSSVQGDGGQAKALGAVIGAAVQAELIKQKRPGGLLY
jgi:tape measure domain-containing protein